MCSLACPGDDDFEPAIGGFLGELDGLVGCLVCRQHPDFGLDTEVIENLGGLLHNGSVRTRSHDDGNFVTHGPDGNRAVGRQIMVLSDLLKRTWQCGDPAVH